MSLEIGEPLAVGKVVSRVARRLDSGLCRAVRFPDRTADSSRKWSVPLNDWERATVMHGGRPEARPGRSAAYDAMFDLAMEADGSEVALEDLTAHGT